MRQGADVAVFEGALGAKGDLDGMFAVGGDGRVVAGAQDDVYDTEVDLGLSPSLAASNTGTFGGVSCSGWEESFGRIGPAGLR